VALELVRGRQFDLAIIDYRMPGMPGAALGRAIAELQQPFMFLSACVDPESARDMRAAGALSYAVKPMDPPALVATIRALLGRDL
jgi:DNA-binding response OmpR family regulator